jgi:hypothetical protein
MMIMMMVTATKEGQEEDKESQSENQIQMHSYQLVMVQAVGQFAMKIMTFAEMDQFLHQDRGQDQQDLIQQTQAN